MMVARAPSARHRSLTHLVRLGSAVAGIPAQRLEMMLLATPTASLNVLEMITSSKHGGTDRNKLVAAHHVLRCAFSRQF